MTVEARPRVGRIRGPARASAQVGTVEFPVTLTQCGKPVTVQIARWEIRRFIAQLERAETSATRVRELRRSSGS